MRPSFHLSLRAALVLAAAACSASPALAQFAPASSQTDYYSGDGGQPAEASADYDYAQSYDGTATDPYAADPSQGAAPQQPIANRTVADIAAGIFGAKGARRAQDIGAILGDVTGKGQATSAEEASSASEGDAVSLLRNVLSIARKKKAPQ